MSDRLESRQSGMCGEPKASSATASASKLVSTQQSTASESAPKRSRTRLIAALAITSRLSSMTVSCSARHIPAATRTVRSMPETGSPRLIQARIASSTRPMRKRRRSEGTKEP